MTPPERPQAAPRPTAAAEETQRNKIWAAAMIEVAGETAANLASLPPAERESARHWAEVLSDVARDLLSGAPAPTLSDLPRPWA